MHTPLSVRLLQVASGVLLASVGSTTASAAPAKCEHAATAYQAGRAVGPVCQDELTRRGLTAIDLGDAWTPYALAGAATAAGQSPPAYHDTFIKLAAEKYEAGSITEQDGSLEFYGIPPNFEVVLARMDDEARHACHDKVADEPMTDVGVLHWEQRSTGEKRQAALKRLRGLTEAAMKRHGLDSRDKLAATSKAQAKQVAELQRAEARSAAVAAMHAHLACEGLSVATQPRGLFDWHTSEALRAYQRRHWIVASGELDRETIDAMRGDPRELELRLALRVLRQRVADAAGLIEDGSARAEWGTVLGLQLDGPEMRYQGDWPVMENGAPDRISPATEAAAAALGWKDFASVRESLRKLVQAEDRRIAVKLPPAPSYHHKGVELRAVIDRGEVSYAVPKGKRSRAGQAPKQRPVLIVYAKDGDKETALVRWPTTIGGWQDEKLKNGAIARKYKSSDTGPRLWRDLVVAPVWYAPKSTPDSELIRPRNGKWELKDDLVGPGYRSAYGLAMLIHHLPLKKSDGTIQMVDRAIRTHGSVNYQSIVRGDSHGCHRTYNHQILRLTSFLLRHHEYTIKGPLQETWVRKVRHGRSRFDVRRTDRGFYYELTPPVPVDVLEGTVVSRRQAPVKRALYGLR